MPESPRFPVLAVLGIGLAVLLALLPGLDSPVRHHGDELFYTDGAMRMVDNGDWLVPRTTDGVPRLNKPPLTYWVVAVSFHLQGIGLWQSRLPSVLAGMVLVVTAAGLGWLLAAPERARMSAVAAAALMAANAQAIEAAGRAMPDILLAAGLGLSMMGFVRMLQARPAAWAGWCAWLGLALAVLVKGLLPLVMMLVVGVWAWRRRRLRQVVHPAALVAVILVVGWFLAVVVQVHQGFGIFWKDQVASRLEPRPQAWLMNLMVYPLAPLAHAPVAVLLLGLAAWRQPAAVRSALAPTAETALPVLWAGVLCLVFMAGNLTHSRYLLPCYPGLMAMAGLALAHLDVVAVYRFLRPCLIGGLMAAGLVLAGMGWLAGPDWPGTWPLTWAILLLLGAAGLLLAWRRATSQAAVALPALVCLVLLGPALAWMRQAWRQPAEETLVRRLLATPGLPRPLPASGDGHVLGRVRVMSGGRCWPVRASDPRTALLHQDPRPGSRCLATEQAWSVPPRRLTGTGNAWYLSPPAEEVPHGADQRP